MITVFYSLVAQITEQLTPWACSADTTHCYKIPWLLLVDRGQAAINDTQHFSLIWEKSIDTQHSMLRGIHVFYHGHSGKSCSIKCCRTSKSSSCIPYALGNTTTWSASACLRSGISPRLKWAQHFAFGTFFVTCRGGRTANGSRNTRTRRGRGKRSGINKFVPLGGRHR